MTTKMTNYDPSLPPVVEGAAPLGNVIKMLRDNLPRAVREQRRKIEKLENSLRIERITLENLLAHAHVEKLPVDAATIANEPEGRVVVEQHPNGETVIREVKGGVTNAE
jgi:hypothetical protein